jgi:adenine deaminase
MKDSYKQYLNKNLVQVALGDRPADMVVTGGKLVNVYTGKIEAADISVAEGRIAAIGDVAGSAGEKTITIDASGKYIAPGLIDAHLHAEVPKVTFTRLANAVVERGTTSVMTPLDQMGVVNGIEGMRWVLDEAKKTPLKVFHSCPSRLPYTTPASTIAYTFGPKEHAVAQKWEEAVGIWEYMNDSILDFDDPVYEAAEMAIKNKLTLHGHAPVTMGKNLAAHVTAGMRDDHESYTPEEMEEKLANGVYGLIRRGTHTDNVPSCIKVVTELGLPTNHLCLCTDDLDSSDITGLGLIDYLVRYVIELGVDPVTALQMGSLNTAECYRVDHLVGSVTPGRIADMLLISDLEKLKIDAVIADGSLVAERGKMINPIPSPEYPPEFYTTMNLQQKKTANDIYITVDPAASKADVLAVHLEPEEGLLSQGREVTLEVKEGRVLPDAEQGINYITVTDRHSGEGLTGRGFISGFDLKEGAIATSTSPDDNNIICIGASVDDMATAINHLADIGGGQTAVRDGKVLADIPLPVCGLMADITAEEMAALEKRANEAAYSLGTGLKKPFFFIIFLSITAIPEYAMTDLGLVAHASRSVIDPVKKAYAG